MSNSKNPSAPPLSLPGKRGYPRPQLQRKQWKSLNGAWEFALDPEARARLPGEVQFDRKILVPFAPETKQSGIEDTGFHSACWYRRTVKTPSLQSDERLILHFGAVDYEAAIFIDGKVVGSHTGGYTPFQFDITENVGASSSFELCVRALDDPHDLTKPRGKQDWQLQPHAIWYPRTTGIWQTVWWERVNDTSISSLRWTPSLEHWAFGFEAHITSDLENRQLWLRVRLVARGELLADDIYRVVANEVNRRIALSDPGIDDFRNALLWSPESPTLVHAQLELSTSDGKILDRVHSYTALRSVCAQGDRFVLNGRPYPMRLVLDQGYWPDSGMTAPDDKAIRHDVELVKLMGFNGVRKHQKIEDPRFLYWADRLGLLVWEEMPSAYRFSKRSIERLCREWMEAILRDVSHPCIVAWVPFNESWGVPNLPNSAMERHYVQGLYHLTRSLDASRLVVGNDGWETTATDMVGIHDYDASPQRMARRYFTPTDSRLLQRERPGGRLLVLEGHSTNGAPVVLSEFGGIAFSPSPESWGYTRSRTAREFAQQFARLMETINRLEMFTGYCYTQFSDTFQEANGLLYADRTPKFPLQEIANAVRANLLVLPEALDLHDVSQDQLGHGELDNAGPPSEEPASQAYSSLESLLGVPGEEQR